MVSPSLSLIMLGGLALGLIALAVIDWRSFRIANRHNLIILSLAPAFWIADDATLMGIGLRLAAAAGVFLFCLIMFRIGQMGGGDVKLATVLGLWLAPEESLLMVVIMALIGCVLTAEISFRHYALKQQGARFPFSVIVAVIALWLWFVPTAYAIAGLSVAGCIALIVTIVRKGRGALGKQPKIPYGVAIAVGALWVITQRFLNHFGA